MKNENVFAAIMNAACNEVPEKEVFSFICLLKHKWNKVTHKGEFAKEQKGGIDVRFCKRCYYKQLKIDGKWKNKKHVSDIFDRMQLAGLNFSSGGADDDWQNWVKENGVESANGAFFTWKKDPEVQWFRYALNPIADPMNRRPTMMSDIHDKKHAMVHRPSELERQLRNHQRVERVLSGLSKKTNKEEGDLKQIRLDIEKLKQEIKTNGDDHDNW
jgi:hypothetical protein